MAESMTLPPETGEEEDWFTAGEFGDTATGSVTVTDSAEIAATQMPLIPIQRRVSRVEQSSLFFDIETVPDLSRVDSFGLDPLPTIMPETPADDCPVLIYLLKEKLETIERTLFNANPTEEYLALVISAERLSDKPRVGIEKAVLAVRSNREKIKNAAADRQKIMSVTPEYCRVAAIGWAVGAGELQSLTCGEHAECDTADERTLLETFWSLVLEATPIIGFNVLHFDLRVIMVRSAILGVMPSRLLDLKPWGRDVIDLMVARFGGMSGAMGLKKLAPLYGIDVPAGDCDGSQVAGLMATDPVKVGTYVRSDVHVTREFYRRLSGFFFA